MPQLTSLAEVVHAGRVLCPACAHLLGDPQVAAPALWVAPSAVVSLRVSYQDGSQWTTTMELDPEHLDMVLGLYPLYMDCWTSDETDAMFGRLVPDVPVGAEYMPNADQDLCKDHTGRIVPL